MFDRFTKKAFLVLTAAAFCFLGFVGTAYAASAASAVAPQDESAGELARAILEAIKDGKAWLAAASAVILALGLAKKYIPATTSVGKFITSDVGGMLSAFLFAFAGAVATAAVSFTDGSGMTVAIAWTAGKVGLGAIGGYVAIVKFATWLVSTKFYQDKAPAWFKTGFALVLSIIGSNVGTNAAAVKKAEEAGVAAVAANPGKGSGDFTDV